MATMILRFKSRKAGYTEVMMAVAREHIKAGKKVLFGYHDQRRGIATLTKYFPGMLIEIVGDCGLRVWERNKK